jgi:hypothetical protein
MIIGANAELHDAEYIMLAGQGPLILNPRGCESKGRMTIGIVSAGKAAEKQAFSGS